MTTTTTSVAFRLPDGWTLRKVAADLAREWLQPFLAKSGPKAPRWIIQPVMEPASEGELPLWEAGITTEEYEARLDRADVNWIIRANVARGRGKGSVLARLRPQEGDREVVEMTVFPTALPETLFDAAKVDEYLQEQGQEGMTGLFVGLLSSEGMQPIH